MMSSVALNYKVISRFTLTAVISLDIALWLGQILISPCGFRGVKVVFYHWIQGTDVFLCELSCLASIYNSS